MPSVFLDSKTCTYCGRSFSLLFRTTDHVIPISKGGKRGHPNTVSCCISCNKAKGDFMPSEFIKFLEVNDNGRCRGLYANLIPTILTNLSKFVLWEGDNKYYTKKRLRTINESSPDVQRAGSA